MKDNPLVSIIVRTKNEERWIGHCLRSVFSQNYNNFEVILVDNCSSDQTVAKAQMHDITLVTIKDFTPGKAINAGIRESKGDIVVCLSGHCIPVNDMWLENLIADLCNNNIAGVYGRQEPFSFSSDLDKRDLMNVFGLDRKIQTKDSFFHNANSAIRRDIWETFPWDEETTNIEDRLWARQVLNSGYQLIYEPEASVYHHHGIHHDLNTDRAHNVVRIMEKIDGIQPANNLGALTNTKILAVIPVKGDICHNKSINLLEHTILAAQESELISDIIVSTDNSNTADFAINMGAQAPFLRPSYLSSDYVGINEVMRWTVEKIESTGGVHDLVLILEETYPFRPPGMLNEMIEKIINEGLDTVVACHEETRNIWLSDEHHNATELLKQNFTPRKFMDHSAHIGLIGLGCITHAEFVRNGEIFGPKLGIYDIPNPISGIEVHDKNMLKITEDLLMKWRTRGG